MNLIRSNHRFLSALILGLTAGPLYAQCVSLPLEDVASTAAEPVSGSASLCSQNARLRALVHLDELAPGNVYSVWWAYFDDPAVCAIPWQCGVEDLRYETAAEEVSYPPGALGRIGAVVARGNGKARFTDTLIGLWPPDGAELWLVVMGHGPAAPLESMARARQLLTPENSNFGGSFTGNDADGMGSEWLAVARYTYDPASFSGEGE